jgi:hypothetical protein
MQTDLTEATLHWVPYALELVTYIFFGLMVPHAWVETKRLKLQKFEEELLIRAARDPESPSCHQYLHVHSLLLVHHRCAQQPFAPCVSPR